MGQSPSSPAEYAMKLFIDSADPKEIADCAATGLIDGVTTEGPLTDKGLAAFLENAKRAGAKLKAE
jgi:transaldolase